MPTEPDPVPQPLDHLAERGEGGAAALILRDGTLTYEELRARVALLAGWLSREVEPGERVASWAAKGELTCLLPLAAARAGLVHVPINPLLKRAQATHILHDCGASLLIGTQARLDTLDVEDLPPRCRAMEERRALALAAECADPLGPSDRDPQELTAILYTSGSTGRPKGVMLSHANMWLGAASVASYLGLRSDDVTLAVLPLSFDYGQNQLLSTWHAGGCVVPLDYLFARDVVKACSRHRITTLAGVPPLWTQLSEVDWPAEAIAGLRRITNSGGALSSELVRALRARFPVAEIVAMYGLTEAFRSTYLDPALIDAHPTSMGRAIPLAEILVVDESGRRAAVGVEGELVHCGPLVAQGYWHDPERTAQRFRPAPAESEYGGIAVWSGDRVRCAEDGLLYFAGRHDAMIKSAGVRISPQEIEDAALSTGLVAEAVAVGLPDERLGQAIHLVVRADAESGELAARLARELPNFMQPHTIHWRHDLPTTPNGKLDREAIAREISR